MTDIRQSNAVRSLDEINHTFNKKITVKQDTGSSAQKPRISFLRALSDVLFYVAIAIILYSVISVDMGEGGTRSVMGYSAFTVMSSSMKDELPKGTLIVVKEVEPQKLQIGDNITYMRGNNISVTHKIVDIFDVNAEGERRFQTKGVNNASPDDYTVAEDEILGKVIISLPGAGTFLNSFAENIHIVLIIFLLCSLLSFLLRSLTKKKDKR